MPNDTLLLVGILTALLLVILLCILGIRKAIIKGKIPYSGNRLQLSSQTYDRKESPMGFCAGIAVHICMMIFAIIAAAVFIVVALGG